MRKLAVIFLAWSVAAVAASAETKPSEASIRRLLAATEAHQLVDSMTGRMDVLMRSTMEKAMQGRPLDADAKRAIDAIQARAVSAAREELQWEKLEPMYVRIYSESFSQDEVDAMVAFYESPAGQAVVRKLPIVMQKSMEEMQALIGPMVEKIMKSAEEEVSRVSPAAPAAK